MVRDASKPPDDGVLLGVVTGAHGLKGEVKVKTFTDTPESLRAYGPVLTGDGRQFQIAELRATKGDEAVVVFKGMANRNAAESLKGVRLYVPRASLPEPDDDEFYLADLVGLAVEDEAGVSLGIVRGVHNFGAGDMVEIEAPDARIVFVPFTSEAVPVVDIPNRKIVVILPAEGPR